MNTLKSEFGIITMAHGPERYLQMAINLARSLELTNPGITRAIITDATNHPEIKKLYQLIIPINETFGKGLIQKLYLSEYSPFQKTLFIDSDCLVIDRLVRLISLCQNHSFVALGEQVSDGKWFMDIPQMLKRYNLLSLPKFNGGLYYFENNDTVKSVFNTARELASKYFENGFLQFRGGINEEPLLSVAMALHNITAIEDNGTGMRTPLGISGSFNVDFLNSHCSFIKRGVKVTPVVIHFTGRISREFHYKRETLKVKLRYNKVPKFLVRSITDGFMNTGYACFVFAKRCKAVVGGNKPSFNPTLPIFSGH